jgi:hypothetical protein
LKLATLVPAAALFFAAGAIAQKPIWRCNGNAYTNDQGEAQAKNCKLVEGGNVTVVTGTRVAPVATTAPAASPAAPAARVATAPPRIDSTEQRTRDAEARAILEAELKKAEVRQDELLKEWNNGEPEKMGPEHRNHQKYLDRVAELKASIARNENDIAGLKRELSRAK